MSDDLPVQVSVGDQVGLDAFAEFADCNSQQFAAVINLCFAEYLPLQTSVELCFMNEADHCAAHEQFLNNSSATDVMSFPYVDDDCRGELLVNVEMAVRRAPEFGHSAIHELMLYVIHGTLHLLGFDDKTAEDVQKMRAAEKNIMQQAIVDDIF